MAFLLNMVPPPTTCLLLSLVILQGPVIGKCDSHPADAAETFTNDTLSGDEEYYDYIEIPEVNTTCSDGDSYRTLEECTQECWMIHENLHIENPVPKSESGPKRYKVVNLTREEFVANSDGSLSTTLPKDISLPKTFSHIKQKGIAHVCYPLDEELILCKKWGIPLDEFQMENKSRVGWAEPYKRYYHLGEFYLDLAFQEVVICVDDATLEHHQLTQSMDVVFVIAYIISATSLMFCFALSILIPELNLRNNKILLCHMLVLSTAYWMLVIQESLPETTVSGSCKALAFFKQFTFLSSFFWINVQAIDLFIRFINLRGQNLDPKIERCRFIAYSVYAWGCPLVICVITIIMEQEEVQELHPNFTAANNCWFNFRDQLTMFVYFYGPIAIILLANVILFILTIIKLVTVSKTACNVNKKLQHQLLQLYLKLVVVMGLCWIMEIISWGVGGKEKFWYFTDLINALQGLLIFIVYICKPSYVRRLIYQNSFFPNRPKWWPWQRDEHSADNVDGTKTRGISTTSSLAATECQSPI